MLDKQSEKILKLIQSKYEGNTYADILIYPNDTGMHYSELSTLCLNLLKHGYICDTALSYNQDEAVQLTLTHEGLHYFELKHKGKRLLWLKSAWIPIIVTLVTNLLVAVLKWLSPQILEWCTNFLEKISS